MRENCSHVIIENFFEPCVLFLLSKKKSYGYELKKELVESCVCSVNTGNLYRGLSKLVKNGQIIKQKMKSEIGPDRVIYEITDGGKRLLSEWINQLEKQNEVIANLIRKYKSL